MKILLKVVIVILVIAGVLGLTYWQMHKKGIIKDTIKNAIQNKTDSLYYIRYDSSFIDEVAGDASFYNVSLQSDSAQDLMIKNTDSLPASLYNIRVGEVTVKGVDIAGLIANERVAATNIILKNAVVRIIKTGNIKDTTLTTNDTLELYQRITGKFNSIKTKQIDIQNARIMVTNKAGQLLSSYNGINIQLNDLVIDENHDYRNIIAYFVKDIHAVVNEVLLPVSEKNARIILSGVEYDAIKKIFHVNNFRQYDTLSKDTLVNLNNIHVNELNTEAFINRQKLDAGTVSCDGGLLTIYRKNKKAEKDTSAVIELYDDFVEQIKVKNIKIGGTKLVVINTSSPNEKPFVLNNLRVTASDIAEINKGATIASLFNQANFTLSADGVSFFTKDNVYKISTGAFSIDNSKATFAIEYVKMKPIITEKQFVARRKFQKDLFDLEFNKIVLTGLNTQKIIKENELWADDISLQTTIKSFNDRTIPFDTNSKVGKYPHQQLLNLPFKYNINTIHVNNSYVSYRERGRKSELVGDVNFKQLNAVLSNVTNMPERIKANSTMKLNAKAIFAGASTLTTEWFLPLNKYDTNFIVRGELSGFNAVQLNSFTKPLALAAIEEGTINKITFNLKGGDYQATGTVNFLYSGLKVKVLKKEDDNTLEKKGLMSFLANMLVKNDSKEGEDNKVKAEFQRDITKSYFNLLWKTIFNGVKQTVMGKN